MRILEKLRARTADAGKVSPALIACIGDSVTHGCFEVFIDHRGDIAPVYEPDSAYPARLKRRLDSLYPAAAVSILNAGVSGETAAMGASRLERDVLMHNPDLVVIAFGLNDAMDADSQLNLVRYRAALNEMLAAIRASGAECIVMTCSHMCTYIPSSVCAAQLREIAAHAVKVQTSGTLGAYMRVARAVALQHGAALADAYAFWEALAQNGVDTTALLSNGINHPTREAHDIFVAELLRTMLASDAK